MTVVAPPRTVHVEPCMGTVFTVDIRDAGEWAEAVADVARWLHRVDRVFSTYRPDSDISRMQRGELTADDADPNVALVLDLCAQVQTVTEYHFTAMPHGRLDPTGLVKGWAIERASELLSGHGAVNHAVNGGGDMQLAGSAEPGRPWAVGISDPLDRTSVRAVVSGTDVAVATSGTAERGDHIVDPFGRRDRSEFVSATVVGPSLTRADAYATAAFVMGDRAPRWIDTVDGYEAMLVRADGTTCESAGWHRVGRAVDAPDGANS